MPATRSTLTIATGPSSRSGQADQERESGAGDDIDLDRRVPGEPGRLDGGAGRGVLGEELGVGGVHRCEVVHVAEVDGGLRDAVEGASGGGEDGLEVLEDTPRLGADVARDHLSVGGV